jgi:polyribonucleotide nucleotidyltransferase
MASVCGSTLALMDAGVPIKNPVAGISIGLVVEDTKNPDSNYQLMVDIQGPEDHHGDMDFKVAGSKDGITAIQMDVKIPGITQNIIKDALDKAQEARLKILEVIQEAIPAPRTELSQHAPRVFSLSIDPSKIRDVIGPGGKMINQITESTGVTIDIEDSGLVFITSKNGGAEGAQKAVEWVRNLTRTVEAGEVFTGKVTRLLNFGAFVEILPGQQGLVHISELAPWHVERVDDIVNIGDTVKVRVKEIDQEGRINLSMKEFTPASAKPANASTPSRNQFRESRGNREQRQFRRNSR